MFISWLQIFRLPKVCGLISLLLVFINVQPVLADNIDNSYQLGKGYALGDSGFRLGGYTNLFVESLGYTPAHANLNSLSLFLSWDNGGKLRFFSETEGNSVLDFSGKRQVSTADAKIALERLYFDYLLTEQITVRVGKMLTPIGQWNLIHVAPLVWTTTRPVATADLFSDYTTGVMVQGTVPIGQQFLDYSVYADYSSALDPTVINEIAFDNAQGFRLRYHVNEQLQIGLSYANFALADIKSLRDHLTGFDFIWSYQRFVINSEIVYRNNAVADRQNTPVGGLVITGNNPNKYIDNAWQGYFQGVAPVTDKLYAVARYEFFDTFNDNLYLGHGQAEVLGLNYKLKNPIVFKAEYRIGKNNRLQAPDGFYASFSVLF